MKIYKFFCWAFIFAYVFVVIKIDAHGFAQGTLIKSSEDGWWLIEQVCELSRKHNRQNVASYDSHLCCLVNQHVKAGAESETNCHFRIGFDSQRDHDVVCTPTQEFYMPLSGEWVPAYALKVGDTLLNQRGTLTRITDIEFIKKPIKVYSLEVKKTHNFFVGYYSVLTHNMCLPIALGVGLGGSFGSGAVMGSAMGGFFGPITFAGGIVVGGLIGIAIKVFSIDKHLLKYRLSFDINVIDKCLKNDGFFPPKKWDGKKVKNPNGPGVGWPDENGRAWVPTGPNGHGGPHWDVQDPVTKRHRNVLPGGRER